MTTADGTVLGHAQIFGTAPPERAFTAVLLAEGFTAAEQGAFAAAADEFVATLTTTPPYDGLTAGIDVFRVDVASTDSGADDPVAAGGTGAIPRTYFDASFGVNGIRRLLAGDNASALATAATLGLPHLDVVALVVNSTVYGGSGGSVAAFSLAEGATEIALHESGHTAFALADEYPVYAGGAETGQDHHPPTEPAEPNVTVVTDRATLKWAAQVAPATALPTMTNPDCAVPDGRPSPVPAGTVGLFEGAHYYHCGAYRPEYDCRMRTLGVPFCAVCRRVIGDRIRARAGLPATGLA